jgi:dTMP kinase
VTRGKFIALEGGEGSGKSTQAGLLVAALRARGLTAEITREPGGTPGAEAIRALLLAPPGEGWGARAEALLFAAARSDHVEKRIVPALDAGTWVVSDRFVDSSRAYQGAAGGLGDAAVRGLHDFGSAGLRPDLTVLIECADDVAARRLARRDGQAADAIGGRERAYHAAVAAAFRQFASDDPGAFTVIDGDGPADAVHARVMAALEPLFGDGK